MPSFIMYILWCIDGNGNKWLSIQFNLALRAEEHRHGAKCEKNKYRETLIGQH